MLRGRRGRPQRVRRRPSGISTRRIREDARRGGAAAAPRIVRGRSSNGREGVWSSQVPLQRVPPRRLDGGRALVGRRGEELPLRRQHDGTNRDAAGPRRVRARGAAAAARATAGVPARRGLSGRRREARQLVRVPTAASKPPCLGDTKPASADFCGVGPRASRSLYGHSTRRRRRLSRRYLRDLADGGFTCDEGAHKAGLVEALARTSGHLDHRTVQFRLKSHLHDARTVGDL